MDELEEITVQLANGKVVRVVAPKGTSDQEAYALAEAQEAGVGEITDSEDLETSDDMPTLPPDYEERMAAAEAAAKNARQEQAIGQAKSIGQMTGAGLGGALSLGRAAGDVGESAIRRIAQGLQSPLGTLPGGPQNTPGQKWAAKVVGQPGLQMRPDDYSVSQAAQRYQRAMPSGKVSGPAAKKYGLGPLDIGRQISTAPPKPSGLEAVTQQFGRLANSGPVSFVARKVLPPVAGAYGLGELAAAAQEGVYSESPDPVRTGLSAASGLGGILSMFPGTAPVGIPMAGAAEIIKALRDYNANRPQITEEDMQRMRAEAGGLQPYVAP
jgi:hypothetical protein